MIVSGSVQPIWKVIFLDVDGVLIHLKCYIKGSGKAAQPDPACIERLNLITDRTEAGIVISSTWRTTNKNHEENIRENQELLDRFGITAKLVGYTKRLECWQGNIYLAKERGDEIAEWLSRHPHVHRFVIIDDDDDMGRLKKHLVQTHFDTGLTDVHVREIIRHLA